MRLIDADRVLRLVDNGNLISNSNYQKVRKLIENIPSIDLVRCKDCKYFEKSQEAKNLSYGYCGYCKNRFDKVFYPEYYCSYGEREEGEVE